MSHRAGDNFMAVDDLDGARFPLQRVGGFQVSAHSKDLSILPEYRNSLGGAGSQPVRDSQSRLDISTSPANAELRAPHELRVLPTSFAADAPCTLSFRRARISGWQRSTWLRRRECSAVCRHLHSQR